MVRTSFLKRLALAALVTSSSFACISTPAAHAAPCSVFGNYFDGASSGSSTSNRGAMGDIAIPATAPAVCGNNSFSDAWVMITDGWGNYAQAGFGVDYLSSNGNPNVYPPRRITFTQYTGAGGGHVTAVFGPPALGTTHSYGNYYWPGDGLIHIVVDLVQYAQTNYSPSIWPSSSWQGQYYNETGHKASEVWGKTSDRLLFYNTLKWDYNYWSFFGNYNLNNDYPAGWGNVAYSPASGGWGVKVWQK